MRDDRKETLLPGEEEGPGAVQGLRGGAGGWIIDWSHGNTTWESGIGDMDLEKCVYGEEPRT